MTALETAEPSAAQTTKGLTAETSNSNSDATDTHSTVDPSAEADRAISSTLGPTDNARFIGVSDAATVSTAEVHDVGLVVGSRLLKTTADPLPPFRRLLAELGIAPDEPVSICHAPEGGKFTATLGTAAGAPGRAFPFVGREHVWFGVNPLRPDLKFGKGMADDVARITSLYSDWDVKPGGLKSTDECRTAIAMVSAALGGRQPVALVLTGSGGIHPYHRLADYPPEDHARAVRDLRVYGMLAKAVAVELGGSADSVQNPDRIMRVPGTVNMKPGCGEVRVEFWDDDNAEAVRDEITLDDLESCLLEAGIRLEEPGDVGYQKAADEDIVRMVDRPESGTCAYAASIVKFWKKDVPKKNRHNWVLNQLVRAYQFRRLGHISRADLVSAVAILKERFLYLHEQGLGGPVQVVDRYEFAGCVAWALSHVEEATEESLRKDVKHDKCSFYADDGAVAGGGGDSAGDVPRRLDVIRADQVKLTRVRYLYDKRIPLRAMTLMPGEEGIGKTTVGVRIIADVTRGTLPGECYGTPRDVVVVSLEDGLSDVYVPRLDEAGADRSRVHIVRAVIGEDGDKEGVILPRDLDRIGELVRSVDAVMVWVDSLVTTLPDELKSISYKDTAKVLKALGGWAEEEGVAVVAPWHLNKASGSNTALRIMDSRAFRTAVRSMLLVVKDPDAPEGVSQGLVVLDKANAGTLSVPGLRYRIRSAPYVVEELDEATGEIREITASCGVADWVGELSAAVAQDAAHRAMEPRIDKDNDPREWLKEYLTDRGRSKRQDVLSAAKLAGFSDSAMKRAARSLAIRSTQETGQHPGGAPFREALWELPEDLLPSSGATQSGQAHDTHPTGPTDPTGEGVCDPIDPVSPSQLQSGQ